MTERRLCADCQNPATCAYSTPGEAANWVALCTECSQVRFSAWQFEQRLLGDPFTNRPLQPPSNEPMIPLSRYKAAIERAKKDAREKLQREYRQRDPTYR